MPGDRGAFLWVNCEQQVTGALSFWYDSDENKSKCQTIDPPLGALLVLKPIVCFSFFSGGNVRPSETIVTVTLRDSKGGVDVDDGGIPYEGLILNFSSSVRYGQEIHLRLDPADLFVPAGTIEIKGIIVDNMFRDGAIDLWAGVEFQLEVKKMISLAEKAKKRGVKDKKTARPVSGIEGFEYLLTDHDREAATVLSPPPVVPEYAGDQSAELDATGEPTGIIGTLRQVSLVEVAQGLELTRKTARIEVRATDSDPLGVVYLRAGQIVWAEYNDMKGDAAFYQMAAMRHGMYRVRFGRSTTETNIEKPLAFLILEAMRLIDEGTVTFPEPPTAAVSTQRAPAAAQKENQPKLRSPKENNIDRTVDFGLPETDVQNAQTTIEQKPKKRPKKKRRSTAVKKMRSGKKAKAKGKPKKKSEKVFSAFFQEAGEPIKEGEEDPISDLDPTFSSLSRAVDDIGQSADGIFIPPRDKS